MYVWWQYFNKSDSANNILYSAQGLMQNSGWQVFNSTGNNNGMVIGGLNNAGDAIVQVTVRPINNQYTYVIVTAYSEDSNTAQRDRDFIVSGIRPDSVAVQHMEAESQSDLLVGAGSAGPSD